MLYSDLLVKRILTLNGIVCKRMEIKTTIVEIIMSILIKSKKTKIFCAINIYSNLFYNSKCR